MIYFIGQNIHLTSLALQEKWWNSAMTGYLAWLAAGGFNAPTEDEVKAVPAPGDKAALPSVTKGKAGKGKAKAAKKTVLAECETSSHS